MYTIVGNRSVVVDVEPQLATRVPAEGNDVAR